MRTTFILGVFCLVSTIKAQQYGSSGPVPQRPLAFAGASSAQIQPERPLVRQRPIARAYQQEPVHIARSQVSPQTEPVVRQRRPQYARARINQIQEQNSIPKSRISSGEAEDVYIRQPAPTLPPLPQTTRFITPKPVVEEEYDEEEEDDTTTPASISRSSYIGPYAPNAAPTPFQRPASAPAPQSIQPQQQNFQRPAYLQPVSFRPSPQITIQQQQIQQLPSSQPSIVRQFPRPQQAPLRPAPQPTPVTRPPLPSTPAQNYISSEEEEDEEEQQYVRQPTRQQPNKRPQPQQQAEQSKQSQLPRQQAIRQPEAPRTYPSKASSVQKEKKPVVQTVRKFHEENEDGSITWGYENDDGTFKEETIGTDCVTRGKYGYYDPDGVKREYTYQTGIPCDKVAEAEQAASSNEGYIDYTSNKYVFPNGDEIDLDAMVKNRARKPINQYRN